MPELVTKLDTKQDIQAQLLQQQNVHIQYIPLF